ncbi:hypothetical protein GCM10025868_27810 [Angustibacter aerolatus]|uniref:Uncharacterized protein n=1 Tax=Angustibacter aerolatus TaxID=1162965 RepID=A0ABQ6JL49_9ACTN|nr:toxic anion resistance protein [Angustibacter aerolatus]GMA87531.1 hypothetical protein GCM10025868_27810 [Angustibacter aerolatus]
MRVAKTLQDLRVTVTDLDPGRADLTGAKKLLGFIPGGNKARAVLREVPVGPEAGSTRSSRRSPPVRTSLRRDNAAIEQEKANLWETMGRLTEYATLAGALDTATQSKVEQARVSDPSAADALTSDALFPIRQRRQDLMTQIAVSVQGYLALEMVRKNNIEPDQGRRPRADDDRLGAADGGHRGAGAGEPEGWCSTRSTP